MGRAVHGNPAQLNISHDLVLFDLTDKIKIVSVIVDKDSSIDKLG